MEVYWFCTKCRNFVDSEGMCFDVQKREGQPQKVVVEHNRICRVLNPPKNLFYWGMKRAGAIKYA